MYITKTYPLSSVYLVLTLIHREVNVQSQQQRIKCHPQGLCSKVDVCQNQDLNLTSPVKDSCLPAHSASLLTSVTLAAGVSHTTWDGKRIPDPNAKDNRKYDMGTSQLSGSPTLNTTSQTSEGIPSFNQGVFSWLKELLLFLFFLLPSGQPQPPTPLKSGK